MMRENLASHAYADDDSDRESDHDKAEMSISVQDVDNNLITIYTACNYKSVTLDFSFDHRNLKKVTFQGNVNYCNYYENVTLTLNWNGIDQLIYFT